MEDIIKGAVSLFYRARGRVKKTKNAWDRKMYGQPTPNFVEIVHKRLEHDLKVQGSIELKDALFRLEMADSPLVAQEQVFRGEVKVNNETAARSMILSSGSYTISVGSLTRLLVVEDAEVVDAEFTRVE